MAFVLTPAICCHTGLGGQAIAAPVAEMAMEDCHGHDSNNSSSHDDHQVPGDQSENCLGDECEDCASASAYDGVANERFVVAASASVDTLATIDDSELAITPIAILVASIHPHRGPPPFVRTTLVALHTLLLN